MRLLKIGPGKTESLFEEYFYGFVVVICVVVAILGKAAGLSDYNAVVTGLWTAGFTWFAGLVRRYRKEQERSGSNEKSRQTVQAPPQIIKQQPPPPNMKPMIGPQWPLKNKAGRTRPVQWPQPPRTTAPCPTPAVPAPPAPAASSDENKPAFVYERPTLPDRKPKLPNNWAGQKGKKPKR